MSSDPIPTPAKAENMKAVSVNDFFAVLKTRKTDVMPRIISNKWDRLTGYLTEWPGHGISDGGTPFCSSRHWISE